MTRSAMMGDSGELIDVPKFCLYIFRSNLKNVVCSTLYYYINIPLINILMLISVLYKHKILYKFWKKVLSLLPNWWDLPCDWRYFYKFVIFHCIGYYIFSCLISQMDYLNGILAISGIDIAVWRPKLTYSTKHQWTKSFYTCSIAIL